MKKLVCPKCKTVNYIILKARNDKKESIAEEFLCSCLHSGKTSELKKETIFMRVRKYIHQIIFLLFWKAKT